MSLHPFLCILPVFPCENHYKRTDHHSADGRQHHCDHNAGVMAAVVIFLVVEYAGPSAVALGRFGMPGQVIIYCRHRGNLPRLLPVA